MTSARPPSEGPLRVLLVTGAVCLVCSVVVTATAQLLKPRIAANQERVRQARVLELVARQPVLRPLLHELGGVDVRARAVDLATGAYAAWIDPSTFDAERAAQDPLHSTALDSPRDLAGIGRRPNHAIVYEVERDGRLEVVILPVYGQGYLSMLRGFLALAGDANTVVGLSFHEHGETPGLGGQVDDTEWLAEWPGKRVRDGEQRVRLGVAEGRVTPGSADADHLVDGLTGATVTSDGVTGLLRFWLGEDGFAPYLRRIQP